jgi:hypothetical protein
VGALAFAAYAEAEHRLLSVVGGLTWERRPIDPIPGARRLDELTGALRLNDAVALARADTTGPGGFSFAESRMAGFLGRRTVLVDPGPGPAAVGRALADAAQRLGADLVVLLDVGGDVLAHGDEPGLASPLADATLLAAAPALRTPSTHTSHTVTSSPSRRWTTRHARSRPTTLRNPLPATSSSPASGSSASRLI